MEVYKRPGSPSWYVDLAHPTTGERVRQSLKFTGSKVEAQKRARKLEAEMETTHADTQSITVGEAVDQYVAALAARGQVAAKDHAYRRDRLFGRAATAAGRWVLDPATPLHTITASTAEALVLARTREGKKPQTIKHDISLIRAATRYAGELGFKVPPSLKDWAKRVPKVIQKTRYLNPEEFERVAHYLDPQRPVSGRRLPEHLQLARREVHDLLVALAYTGGRWSEVAHLAWDRVDLVTGTIRLWAGKTQRERVVPIAEPLGAVLRRRLGERGTSALVFPGPGGRPRSQPSGAIGDAMSAVGLNEPETVLKYGRATVHSLRHTFASWLIQNGADLSEVADALGHASLNMTKRYAHLSKGATLAKLGGILNGITVGDRDAQHDTAPAARPEGSTVSPHQEAVSGAGGAGPEDR